MALHLPIGPFKTRSKLEPVRIYEHSTYQPISRRHSHCAIGAGDAVERFLYFNFKTLSGWLGEFVYGSRPISFAFNKHLFLSFFFFLIFLSILYLLKLLYFIDYKIFAFAIIYREILFPSIYLLFYAVCMLFVWCSKEVGGGIQTNQQTMHGGK